MKDDQAILEAVWYLNEWYLNSFIIIVYINFPQVRQHGFLQEIDGVQIIVL